MGSHYSNVQNPETVGPCAEAWAKHLIKKLKPKTGEQKKYPVLVYTGMSGIGAATVLMMKLHGLDPDFKFGMMYVRKDHEDSHGTMIEHNTESGDGLKTVYVFVDDFICGGGTYARAMTAVYKQFHRGLVNKFKSRMTMVVLMNYSVENTKTEQECEYF